MRRIRPAITLFLLAPLVAEFLLGNRPIVLLPALLILAPMYGGGALLIREVASECLLEDGIGRGQNQDGRPATSAGPVLLGIATRRTASRKSAGPG